MRPASTPPAVPASGRVQLALNVSDVDAAVEFYSRIFGVPPAKRRSGYANFAIESPPLKLVLIEHEAGGTLNHLGVEVVDTAGVDAAAAAFAEAGLVTDESQSVECCYAKQDKVFVTDPDGAEWEWYTVLDDSPVMAPTTEACC